MDSEVTASTVGDDPHDDLRDDGSDDRHDITTIVESRSPSTEPATLDLDRLSTELADVEAALARLDSGEYWTCEITGEPLADAVLEADPTARRTPGR